MLKYLHFKLSIFLPSIKNTSRYVCFNYEWNCLFLISGYSLQVNMLTIDRDTCEGNLRWSHPTVNFDLITNYIVRRYYMHYSIWFYEEMVSVGVVTQYSTNCTLQPGRLYMFSISPIASLTDPDETFEVFSTSVAMIMGRYWSFFSVFITTNLNKCKEYKHFNFATP